MMYMILLMNMMFIFMNHPMSMGLTLIAQTIVISMISGIIMKSFWMSYILLITMLSGMLVLFIYMSTIASNEKFKNNMSLWIMMMTTSVLLMMFLILENKMIIKNNYLSLEMINLKVEETQFLGKLFNKENMIITIMMVMYLWYTMISSTFLINIFEGPMRKKN